MGASLLAVAKSIYYLPREKGGRGLRSVEHEYKITKIKSLMKLYQNSDQTVEAVREFEEHAMASGHQSLVKAGKQLSTLKNSISHFSLIT